MKGFQPPNPAPIPPCEPPIPPPAAPFIPPWPPPSQLGPQCIPPPPPIPPLTSTTPSRLTVTAAERPQEEQTGAAAIEAPPTQPNIKLNAAIVGSRRIREPFDPPVLATIEAQIKGPIRDQDASISPRWRIPRKRHKRGAGEPVEARKTDLKPAFHNRRSTIISLMWMIALAGFRPLGHVWAQFMIVWQR
jgi:hypothetical protein